MAQPENAHPRPIPGPEMRVWIYTFGYDRKAKPLWRLKPSGLIDCRCLYDVNVDKYDDDVSEQVREAQLWISNLDGRCRSVQKVIREKSGDLFPAFFNRELKELCERLEDAYRRGRRVYKLAVGSRWGRHRSVLVALLLQQRLPTYFKHPLMCTVEHLHLEKNADIPKAELETD